MSLYCPLNVKCYDVIDMSPHHIFADQFTNFLRLDRCYSKFACICTVHHHYSFALCWLHQAWSQNLGLYFSMLWTYDNKWTLSVSLLSTTYLDLEICARVHTCGNIDHKVA